MSIFIKKDDRVSVSIDGGTNVVWIKRKMDVGTQNRVQDALIHITGIKGDRLSSADLMIGRQNTILLQENIVAWEGPLFRDEYDKAIPCNAQMIESMDPDDPLVDAVLAEINERNRKATPAEEDGTPADPLASTTALSANGKNGSGHSGEQPKKAAPLPT